MPKNLELNKLITQAGLLVQELEITEEQRANLVIALDNFQDIFHSSVMEFGTMTRQIKFRAWDKETKIMYPLRAWDFAHGFCEIKKEHDNCPDEENLDIMQFTGLLDKNGVEIYEGDIFKHATGAKSVITFETKQEQPSEHLGGINFDAPWDYSGFTGFGFAGNGEVIGNIYSNPELLT